ncbi:hypothetical protein [Tsukamurella paurometabola]|uniref:Integral membrane protein n=1 Tax=Tsukamurella paurometabola TaxID=2061 RepID=A0ABS5N6A8_TSUPA|nr:hypothetical protein [Tsukamurella paurometabola]MBS4099744.1 hypothetical protein [Tsukamurella paurometabola]
MGVFDGADEGTAEAQAYRAELAAENDRIAVKVLPVILVLGGLLLLWASYAPTRDVVRGLLEPEPPVPCAGAVMRPGDTCWAVLTEGSPTFELLAPAGMELDPARAETIGRAGAYPYDYVRTAHFQRTARSGSVVGAIVFGSCGALFLVAAAAIRRFGRRDRGPVSGADHPNGSVP